MQILALAVERPYWQNILTKLSDRGLKFSHVVVQYRYSYVYNKFFERYKPALINGRKFYRIEDMAELLNTYSAPLDEKIIKAMEFIERDFYTLTDRFCYFPKSFRYRKRLFRDLLRYWFGFFSAHKIDKLLISCSPHNLSDFVGFNVAKYLGIPTLQIYHSMINNHILLREHYAIPEIIPAGFLENANEEEIIKHIPPALYKSAFEESDILKSVIAINDEVLGQKGLNVKIKKKKNLARLFNRLYRSLFQAPKFKGALALNGVFPPSFRRILRFYDIIWKNQQKKIYEKLAIEPNLNEKYIYFALHVQPERTSTPESGIFEDQLVALEILSQALPVGWKLYVKENPRQYDRKLNLFKGLHARDESDYEDILKLPNTYLIKQNTLNQELISKAQIIATLAGSVGWEALHKAKPVFIFANAWYAACQGCFLISNVEEAKQALEKARGKTPQAIRLDMLRYLAFMKDRFIIGDVGEPETLRLAKKPSDELENEVVNALFPLLNRV